MNIRKLVRALAILALLVPFMSETARAGALRHRERNQVSRIAGGVENGSLTRAETHWLRRGEKEIRHDIARARSDGHVGVVEAAHIQRELDRQSRRIYVQKHDAQQRKDPVGDLIYSGSR